MLVFVRVYVCVCVRVRVRACVCVCVRVLFHMYNDLLKSSNYVWAQIPKLRKKYFFFFQFSQMWVIRVSELDIPPPPPYIENQQVLRSVDELMSNIKHVYKYGNRPHSSLTDMGDDVRVVHNGAVVYTWF